MRSHIRAGCTPPRNDSARHDEARPGRRAALGILCSFMGAVFPSIAQGASWQPVGKLAGPRTAPRVTLLADGTALVTGGLAVKNGQWIALAMAERFDP